MTERGRETHTQGEKETEGGRGAEREMRGRESESETETERETETEKKKMRDAIIAVVFFITELLLFLIKNIISAMIIIKITLKRAFS